jgi:hypothetical protein
MRSRTLCTPRAFLSVASARVIASAIVPDLSPARRMGGYGAPPRVRSSGLSTASMPMAWTVTPPRRSLIRRGCRGSPIISQRNPGKRANKNQQRNDLHFSSRLDRPSKRLEPQGSDREISALTRQVRVALRAVPTLRKRDKRPHQAVIVCGGFRAIQHGLRWIRLGRGLHIFFRQQISTSPASKNDLVSHLTRLQKITFVPSVAFPI